MKLRSFSLLALVILVSLSMQAQKKSALTLRAGVNLADVTVTEDGRFDKENMLTTFQAGLLLDIPMAKMVSLQTGAIYMGKGTKVRNGDPDTDATWYKATSNPFYIEVPLNVVLHTPGKKANLFIGAGPYIAAGVAGKNKVEGQVLGTTFRSEKSISFSDDDPTTLNYEEGAGFGIMRRLDHGFNGMIGLESKKATFSVNYGLGLAKIQSGSNSSQDEKNKHRVLSFTVGFKL
ncbi:MAG: hypothetical protein C4308_05525 [Chitinophagaceae bacterium]